MRKKLARWLYIAAGIGFFIWVCSMVLRITGWFPQAAQADLIGPYTSVGIVIAGFLCGIAATYIEGKDDEEDDAS